MQDTTLAGREPHSEGRGDGRAGARIALYCAIVAALVALHILLRGAPWTALRRVPAMLELSAVLVSLIVGLLALVRYYSRTTDMLLLLGAGMVGTAVIGSHHLILSMGSPELVFVSDPTAAEPWSAFAASLFPAILLTWSWMASTRERRTGRWSLSDIRIYVEVAGLTLLPMVLFALGPLPDPPPALGPLDSPLALIPGALFALTGAGYLRTGTWRHQPFESWLVPALLLLAGGHSLLDAFAASPYDAYATAGHVVRLLAYACLLVGLVSSMYGLFRHVERSALRIEHANAALRAEIEQRRAAEAAALRSKEQYRTVLDTIREGYFEVDLAGNFLFWNDALARMLDVPPDGLMGEGYRTFTPDSRFPALIDTFGDIYRTGRPVDRFGWDYVRADGERRHAEGSAAPMRDEAGEIIGFRGIVRDVTERHLAEKRLAAKSRELARSNEDLRQFAAVASHDLQEPLRTVAGYTRLLARRYGRLDREADTYLRFCLDGVHRMQTLIRDLLEYSRVQTDGGGFEEVDLAEALDSARADLQSELSRDGATLEVGRLPRVMADPGQMRRLFQNLLANALKFHGGEPPRVEVGSRELPGESQVFVRDHGIGIPDEHAARVFDLFERLHTREEYEGTGIGLAICKRIVERHGGRIWVEPTPGRGATLVFALPRPRQAGVGGGDRADAGGAEPGARRHPGRPGSRERNASPPLP